MTREREREDNLKHDMTHQRAARTQGYIIQRDGNSYGQFKVQAGVRR